MAGTRRPDAPNGHISGAIGFAAVHLILTGLYSWAMASRSRKSSRTKKSAPRRFRPVRWLIRWGLRLVSVVFLFAIFVTVLWSLLNPPTTFYMLQESRRLGGVDYRWVDLEEIAPVMARAAVAAEDANFCLHWGLDVNAIRTAIQEGGGRGASTISQQVVKNVYLWQGRSWVRKVMEAAMTPLVEALWSKRRILEVYLNVVEFDEGVFGIDAAARRYFGVDAASLSGTQAARLAAILPDPKRRSASSPSNFVRKRAGEILDGAATIRADGRSGCFQS